MGDSLRYKDWFEKAAHDLRGAEILMEHDGGNDLVAFHCQQAMEKMLKGWLLKMTGELLDGHSLVFLCRKATAAGAPLKGNLRDCAYVNQFYIETRYPSDSYMPVSEEEAQDCMDAARKLMELLGITRRLLFDYYREKSRKPCPVRLPRFFLKMPKICAIPTKPLRLQGFPVCRPDNSDSKGRWFESSRAYQNVLMKDAAQKTPHESVEFSHIY